MADFCYEQFIDKYDKLISWKNREKREKEFYKKIFNDNKLQISPKIVELLREQEGF